MIRIALLRHGHTAWNRAGRIQGRSDIPLDEDAREILRGFRLPASWAAADLVASPLGRAVETAHLVAGRAPATDTRLIEMNWGAFEGKKGVDLIADPTSGYRHIEDWGWEFQPPDGETPAMVRTRLQAWLADLKADTVAVCHIGIMRVLLAHAHGWDFNGPAPFRIKRNRLFCLRYDAGDLSTEPEPVRLIPQEPAP